MILLQAARLHVNLHQNENLNGPGWKTFHGSQTMLKHIGVRAGGATGAAGPPKFRQLRFFGQQDKIWAKPVFKDVSMFFIIIIIISKR